MNNKTTPAEALPPVIIQSYLTTGMLVKTLNPQREGKPQGYRTVYPVTFKRAVEIAVQYMLTADPDGNRPENTPETLQKRMDELVDNIVVSVKDGNLIFGERCKCTHP